MSVNTFVDTNILVYFRDSRDVAKQQTAATVLQQLWLERSGRISTQVCSEYFVTVTSKLQPGLSIQEAWADIEALRVWQPLAIDLPCLYLAKEVQSNYGLSWWDCLIIAAAQRCGCNTILSEDLNAGQQYLGVTVCNPFRC